LRFIALSNAIPKIEAAEDLRALLVAGTGANPGSDGSGFSEYADKLRIAALGGESEQPGADSKSIATDFDASFPFYEAEVIPGSVSEIRQQMILAAREAERTRHESSS
jgi:hypothetical protein